MKGEEGGLKYEGCGPGIGAGLKEERLGRNSERNRRGRATLLNTVLCTIGSDFGEKKTI